MIYNAAGMHSVSIELLRTGTPHNQTLSPGISYLALCGSHPPAEFRIDLEQYKFNQYLKLLRYSDSNGESRMLAIEALQKIITGIFEQIIALLVEASDAKAWLHIRLVMTPKELGMLPFELALTPKGFQGMQEKPFLLNQQRLTTLTREVRQVASKSYNWPYRVRILFAWAAPEAEVPHEEHLTQLIAALKPFALPFKEISEPLPDVSFLLKEVKNADLNTIQKELESAVLEKNPYTHVHILAHGVEKEDENGKHFALGLQKFGVKEENPVDGLQLASALIVVYNGKSYSPAVVTITACDSGNLGNPLLPGGSLAHVLHASGVPCVFASQFPLSIPGSIKLVECLYPKLVRGDDPRIALYYTREALKNVDANVHDWASLVAYARLPENIDEQLENIRLKIVLETMKTNNGWSDHVLLHGREVDKDKITAIFNDVKRAIETSIHDLIAILDQVPSKEEKLERIAEHYGLLGSAYKRKAEFFFSMSLQMDEKNKENLEGSLQAIKDGQKWYKKGFDLLPANHWSGTQYLSLTAVLNGNLINERKIWVVVKFMAKQDLKEPSKRIWALGTLAELYLLKPLTLPPDKFAETRLKAMTKATEYIIELANSEYSFPVESTIRQLERYINWWPQLIGSPTADQLKEMAAEIRSKLPSLKIS